jgi:hypothetical protein
MGTGYSGLSSYSNWHWALKFAWLPCKMDSGKFVWWRKYYHGVKIIVGPAGEEPVILHQYMTAEEFTWKALKES